MPGGYRHPADDPHPDYGSRVEADASPGMTRGEGMAGRQQAQRDAPPPASRCERLRVRLRPSGFDETGRVRGGAVGQKVGRVSPPRRHSLPQGRYSALLPGTASGDCTRAPAADGPGGAGNHPGPRMPLCRTMHCSCTLPPSPERRGHAPLAPARVPAKTCYAGQATGEGRPGACHPGLPGTTGGRVRPPAGAGTSFGGGDGFVRGIRGVGCAPHFFPSPPYVIPAERQ